MYTLEQLANKDTAIHRLHPSIKLLTTFVYLIVVISFDRYALGKLLPLLFYPFIAMAVSETPYNQLLKRLALALPFSVLAGVSNIIFDTDTALVIGGIAISAGVLSFLTILLKTYLTVMAVLILVSTTSLRDLSNQLIRLKIPPILVMQITMTYRYLSLLLNEASTMFTAYMLRSPRKKGIQINHMDSFVGQLLLRSIDRTERVYYAMKCRGFHGAMGFAQKHQLRTADLAYAVLFCLFTVGLRFFDLGQLLGQMLV